MTKRRSFILSQALNYLVSLEVSLSDSDNKYNNFQFLNIQPPLNTIKTVIMVLRIQMSQQRMQVP